MQKHEMTANVWKISVIGLSALAFWLSGCAMTVPGEESQFREPQLFDAHGRTWKLVEATRYDTRLWFFFITAGGDSQPKNLLYLYKDDGSKIKLHNRIFALQRDGSYKRVDCCSYGGLEKPVFSVDERLVFYLNARMDAVTDCRVHPPFAPDNDQRPPGEQITRAHFFGEFDPAFERVLIREFYPGAEDGRRSDPTRTMLEYEIFMYEARTAFDCG